MVILLLHVLLMPDMAWIRLNLDSLYEPETYKVNVCIGLLLCVFLRKDMDPSYIQLL